MEKNALKAVAAANNAFWIGICLKHIIYSLYMYTSIFLFSLSRRKTKKSVTIVAERIFHETGINMERNIQQTRYKSDNV